MSPDTTIHAECGTPLPKWPPFGRIVSIRDDDAAKLVQFYRGELDELKCQGCGQSLAPAPSLVVSFDEYTLEYMYCGPAAREHPEVVRELVEEAEAKGNRVVTGPASPDELRVMAWGILEGRALAFYRALNVILTGGDEEAWESMWPHVTSSSCAALLVSRIAKLPVLADPELEKSVRSFDSERVSKGLQEVQARTWISICQRWALSELPDSTLERDLNQYLATSAVLGGAPELFFDHVAALDLKTLDGGVKHAYLAAQATLHWLLQSPNPHADEWAMSYLALETVIPTSSPERAAVLDALRVGEQRLKDTITRQSLARAVSSLMAGGVMDSAKEEAVQRAVSAAGHADLVGAGYTTVKLVREDGRKPELDDLISQMRWGLETYASRPAELETWFDLMRQSLPPMPADDLLALTRDLEGPYRENPIALVILRYWVGRILCMRREPEPFLAHVGTEPQAWEAGAPLGLKSILWLWRSRALRVTARPYEAYELLKGLVETDREAFAALKPHIRQLVLGDLALAYLDLGYPDTGFGILTGLLEDPQVERTAWLLAAVANAYTRLGRHADAIPILQEALARAVQPEIDLRPALEADLAYALVLVDRGAEAREHLNRVSEEALVDPNVFVPYAAAWLNLGFEGSEQQKSERYLAVAKRAGQFAMEGLKKNDSQLHLTACRLIAVMAGTSGNRGVWELLERHSRDFEGSPDPDALLVLALGDWERDGAAGARGRLLEFPASLARRHADTRDVSIFIHELGQLRAKLNLLGDKAVREAVPDANARFIGELQRDLLGRVAARGLTQSVAGFVAPDDEAVLRLTAGGEAVAALEWISCSDGIRWLLTTVSERDGVAVRWLEPPAIELWKLREKIHQRLQTWHLAREGDPFDLPAWQSLERWLQETLGAHVPDSATLVVMEHSRLGGIPWHVAAAPRLRTTYVPSWSALLRARDTTGAAGGVVLGLAMTPKYKESAANVGALEESVARTARLAESTGCELRPVLREQCDQEALLRLLESVNVAKILCHGFVSAADNVVALSLAHEGRLPAADSMTAATASGRRHRFDWRECRRLKRSPELVVSAACSSGRSHMAGIGEQLGLFSILRGYGTHSLIAPRWDLKVLDITLPILDGAMERYVRNREPIGEALHSACLEAERKCPRWLAWIFSLEGDWK